MKKALITIGISIVAIVVAIALGISPIVKSLIEHHSEEFIGRKVALQDLSINIFKGSAEIQEFTLFESDKTTPFCTFNLLDVNINLKKLLLHSIEIESVKLSDANIHIIQDGNTFNFDDIIDFINQSETDSTETEEPTRWSVIINDINLIHSYLSYKDNEVGSEWNLNDISVSIPGIDLSDLQANMGLQFDFTNGGKLTTDIQYDTDKSQYHLHVIIDNFHLTPILPYLQQSLNIEDINGEFSTDMFIKGSTEHIMDFNANGNITMQKFSVEDTEGNNIIAIDSAYSKITDIDLITNNFAFESLYISGLSSYYEIFQDSTDNFSRLLKESTNESDTSSNDTITTEPEKKTNLRIASFCIKDSKFTITDHTLPKEFNYAIEEIALTSENFNLSDKNIIQASALLNNSGKLKIKWTGALDDFANQDIIVNLNNLDLTAFTPYSLALFGNSINDGHMSINSENIIKDNKLRGTNIVTMYNPKIGDKVKNSKPAYNVPLKMGLYVLTDKNGKVFMDLPVSGDINSPNFSYRKIIFKALEHLLVKVAASPFNALKSDEDNETQIEIIATESEFTDEQYAQFKRLASLQTEKPELSINLTQQILYTKAIKEYCIIELKKQMAIQDPSNSVNEDNANDPLQRENYINIPDKSPELIAFAEKELAQQNETLKKKDIEDAAIKLYESKMKSTIIDDMKYRDMVLSNYFSKQCSLADSVFTITSELIELDTIKNFKDAYRIEWIMKE